MLLLQKPYLIIPQLVEQSTWGGDYIASLKKLTQPFLVGKKIGQSYELSGKSKILINITDPQDTKFPIEFNKYGVNNLQKNIDYFFLQEKVEQPINILIKLTQALGNSFQLHVKPESADSRWQSKAESWYYLFDGLATLGLKENCDLKKYQEVCVQIENKMQELSQKIISRQLPLAEAKKISHEYIQQLNPWQFVNMIKIEKDDLVDLSGCGIHHSWEEDPINYPQGNILYEVQQDIDDGISSIRSFDKGKFKDDGTIRPVHINDYFKNLDLSPEKNQPENLIKKTTDNNLVKNKHYCLDILKINTTQTLTNQNSFQHLYVKTGEVTVAGPEGEIILPAGYSCFIPQNLKQYQVMPKTDSILLKTYI